MTEQQARKSIDNVFLEPPVKGAFDISFKLIPICEVNHPDVSEPTEHVAFIAHRLAQYPCCTEGTCGTKGHNIPFTTTLTMPVGIAQSVRPTFRSLFALLQHMFITVQELAQRVREADDASVLTEAESSVYTVYSNMLMSMLNDYEFDYLGRVTEVINFDVIQPLVKS